MLARCVAACHPVGWPCGEGSGCGSWDSRAERPSGHDTLLESQTTERQARHTSMQVRPATESHSTLTSYHVPITPGGKRKHMGQEARATRSECPALMSQRRHTLYMVRQLCPHGKLMVSCSHARLCLSPRNSGMPHAFMGRAWHSLTPRASSCRGHRRRRRPCRPSRRRRPRGRRPSSAGTQTRLPSPRPCP